MLALAIGAQGSVAALHQGLPVLAPEVQDRYGLTVAQTGAVFLAVPVGIGLTLLAWGALADRVGERLVIGVTLSAGGLVLALAPFASGLVAFAAVLLVAGCLGSSANAAGGRAVVGWFDSSQRALALSMRQMATPAAAALLTALAPLLLGVGGLDAVLLTLAGWMMLAGLATAGLLRAPPSGGREGGHSSPIGTVLADRRLWRLSLSSSLLTVPQLSFVTYLVLFLTRAHGLGLGAAAGALAAMQALGALGRLLAGHWSDRRARRIEPMRRIALATAAAVAATAACSAALPELIVPVSVCAGAVAMSWNGISFTAVSELAGHRRAGTALGFHTTVLFLAGTAGPLLFGLCGDASWTVALLLIAAAPLAGARMLRPLDEPAGTACKHMALGRPPGR
jgi:sugar phosphate permease